jgi:hypothetical protein
MCHVINYILTHVTFLLLWRKLVQLRNMLGDTSHLTICDAKSFLYTSGVLNNKMDEDFNAHQIFPLLENPYMSYPQSHTCETHNLKRASYEYGRMTLSLLICTRKRAKDQVPKEKIFLQYIHKTSYVQELTTHQTIARAWLFRVQSLSTFFSHFSLQVLVPLQ